MTKIKKTIKKSIKLDDNVEIKFKDTIDDINNLIEKGYDKEKKKSIIKYIIMMKIRRNKYNGWW